MVQLESQRSSCAPLITTFQIYISPLPSNKQGFESSRRIKLRRLSECLLMTVAKQDRMSCAELMYQTGLGSCFPPFGSSSYPTTYAHQPYPATPGAVSSLSPSTFGNDFTATKKYGLSALYPDRSLSTSNQTGTRLGHDASVPSSSRSTVQNISASVSNAYARVGSCSTDSVSGFGRTTNSLKHAQPTTEEERPYDIKYETPTSCLLIYYSGDATTAVEDHFNRALNTTTFENNSAPLRSRNLPASFFDSSPTIHQPQNQQYTCPGSYTLPYHHSYSSTSNTYNYGDPYYSSSFPTSFHQGATDSWHYAFNTASAAAHRTAAMQMAADFTAANRFGSSYNSLLFPPTSSMRSSRLENPVTQCKNESPWTSATHSVFGAEVPHYGSMSSTDYDPAFSAKTAHLQTAKDSYWHV